MYDHDLKANDGYYAKAQALPQNTSTDGNGGSKQLSGTQGGIAVEGEITTELSLTNEKVFSVVLHDSDDDSSYAAKQTLYTVIADSTAFTVPAGTAISEFVLPTDTKRYTKVILTTDDSAATGAVTVFAKYLPR